MDSTVNANFVNNGGINIKPNSMVNGNINGNGRIYVNSNFTTSNNISQKEIIIGDAILTYGSTVLGEHALIGREVKPASANAIFRYQNDLTVNGDINFGDNSDKLVVSPSYKDAKLAKLSVDKLSGSGDKTIKLHYINTFGLRKTPVVYQDFISASNDFDKVEISNDSDLIKHTLKNDDTDYDSSLVKSLDLEIERVALTDLAKGYSNESMTMAAFIDHGLEQDQSSAHSFFLNQLYSSKETIIKELEALYPTHVNTVINLGLLSSDYTVEDLSNRLKTMQAMAFYGYNAGDRSELSNVWLRSNFTRSEQVASNPYPGYKTNFSFITIGVDDNLSEQELLGASYTFGKGKLTADNNYGNSISYNQLSAYYGYNIELENYDLVNIDQFLSVGFNKYDIDKQQYNGTATANFRGYQISHKLYGSYEYKGLKYLVIEPSIALRTIYIHNNSFEEVGQGTLLNYSDRAVLSLDPIIGMKFRGHELLQEGDLIPEFRISYRREYGLMKNTATAKFINDQYELQLTEPNYSKNSFVFGCGLYYQYSRIWHAAINYDHEVKKGYSSDSATLLIKYRY